MDLAEIFHAEKLLPLQPLWMKEANDRLALVSPLDVDGITLEGLRLRVTAIVTRIDECVTAQVEYVPPKRDVRGGALARIEWKPLKGHNNKNVGPLELRNIVQYGSHHHSFDLNWNQQAAKLRSGNLPISVPLDPDPINFKALVDLIGQEFRIRNIDWIELPQWQPNLL